MGLMSDFRRQHDKLFHKWMRDLHEVAIKEFAFPIGSACEAAVKPGAIEEGDWWGFYLDGMTPREALIEESFVIAAEHAERELRGLD